MLQWFTSKLTEQSMEEMKFHSIGLSGWSMLVHLIDPKAVQCKPPFQMEPLAPFWLSIHVLRFYYILFDGWPFTLQLFWLHLHSSFPFAPHEVIAGLLNSPEVCSSVSVLFPISPFFLIKKKYIHFQWLTWGSWARSLFSHLMMWSVSVHWLFEMYFSCW